MNHGFIFGICSVPYETWVWIRFEVCLCGIYAYCIWHFDSGLVDFFDSLSLSVYVYMCLYIYNVLSLSPPFFFIVNATPTNAGALGGM